MDGLLSNERELLARMLQAEAGNQGELGMRAVGAVIDNRRRAQGYGGDTFTDVLLAPGQFSPANSITGYAGGEQGVDLNRLQPIETAYSVADTIMSGQYEDPTNGALNFLNPDISQPSWLSSMQNTVKIGDHLFGTAGSGEGVAGRPGGTQMARQPQGLLGTPIVSTQGQAPEEEKLPFFRRPGVGNFFDTLAIGLGGMTMNPNTALMQVAQNRIQGRREQAQTAQQRNLTLDYLRTLKTPQAEDAIRYAEATGDVMGALKIAREQPERGYNVLTGAQLNEQYGSQVVDPNGLYNVSGKGQVTKVGGGGVNVTMPGEMSGEEALRKEVMKGQGQTLTNIVEAGRASSRLVPDLEALRALAEAGPSGPLQGRFAEMFPEFNDVAAARQAIIRRVAPQMRVEGSGSTSDIEYAGMVESLGRLTNSPEANAAIADMMLAKAQLDQERAALVQQYQIGADNGGISYQELTQRLQELDRVSIMPDSLKRLISPSSSGGAGAGSTSGATEIDGYTIREVK